MEAYTARGSIGAGDGLSPPVARAGAFHIDPPTYLLQTYVHTLGTYASTEFLLVRVDSLLETAIDDAHEPMQRKATLVTRLGEAQSEADAELLVAAVRKLRSRGAALAVA
jgi:hypothetical protein